MTKLLRVVHFFHHSQKQNARSRGPHSLTILETFWKKNIEKTSFGALNKVCYLCPLMRDNRITAPASDSCGGFSKFEPKNKTKFGILLFVFLSY